MAVLLFTFLTQKHFSSCSNSFSAVLELKCDITIIHDNLKIAKKNLLASSTNCECSLCYEKLSILLARNQFEYDIKVNVKMNLISKLTLDRVDFLSVLIRSLHD